MLSDPSVTALWVSGSGDQDGVCFHHVVREPATRMHDYRATRTHDRNATRRVLQGMAGDAQIIRKAT